MVHHDRTATAIRSTNQSIFLYVTEKMEVVFVEDGDGDGVERGGKARCWRGKGEDRVERGWGGVVFVFWGFEHVYFELPLAFPLDQQIDYFPIPSSNEPSASSFLGP